MKSLLRWSPYLRGVVAGTIVSGCFFCGAVLAGWLGGVVVIAAMLAGGLVAVEVSR